MNDINIYLYVFIYKYLGASPVRAGQARVFTWRSLEAEAIRAGQILFVRREGEGEGERGANNSNKWKWAARWLPPTGEQGVRAPTSEPVRRGQLELPNQAFTRRAPSPAQRAPTRCHRKASRPKRLKNHLDLAGLTQ